MLELYTIKKVMEVEYGMEVGEASFRDSYYGEKGNVSFYALFDANKGKWYISLTRCFGYRDNEKYSIDHHYALETSDLMTLIDRFNKIEYIIKGLNQDALN